ncbi:MAG: protein-disulfide reductase DsbD domain-containing protein [Pseudomonadota bacterium]|nr:protein-disulfide reductase DsbD domain-containing protein [Pseudomonadota bacterium]
MNYSFNRICTSLLGPLLIGITFATPTLSDEKFASEWDSQEFAKVRLISGTLGLGDGSDVHLGLEFSLKPDWKIYWRSPGDAGSPPIIDTSLSTNLELLEMRWPWPQRFDEGENLTTVGYQDHVVFPIIAKATDPLTPMTLRFALDYQVCKTICIPVSTDIELVVWPGKQGHTQHTQLIEKFQKKVPAPAKGSIVEIDSVYIPRDENEGTLIINLTRQTPFIDPFIFLEGQTAYRFDKETISLANSSLTAEISVPVSNVKGDSLQNFQLLITLVDSGSAKEISHQITEVGQSKPQYKSMALIGILFTALIGGLILNLMPCVLPVLSIKILSVLQNVGESRLKIRVSFLASAAGILCSYLLLASGTILLRSFGISVGWGMQFQEPIFLVSLISILAIFSCNLFGFFEITSPSFGNRMPERSQDKEKTKWLSQSFFTGAFATLMATPCSAPFVGTSISFALSRGASEILLIFGMLGVGMALPYLLLAAHPGLVGKLPKPGRWMIRLRTMLGFVLVATAVWLLVILSDQTNITLAFSIGAIAVACGTIFKFSSSIIGNKKPILQALSLVVGGCSMVVLLINASPESPSLESPPSSNQSSWAELDAQKIAILVESGKIVFVDITADWCLTCKINKGLVLDRAEIVAQLNSPDIVRMRGDWTKRNPDIQNYLFSFNRFGIPFNAIYGGAAPDGIVLPELLSKTDILLALDTARGERKNSENVR